MHSDTNNNAWDYTKYISGHLLKGKYYTGPSFDAMPKDCSLLTLLKTTCVNIDRETQSLHIKHCIELVPGQKEISHEKNILISCLNHLIQKYSITHIKFNSILPVIIDQNVSKLSDLQKNNNKIPIILFSQELISFFQNLKSIEHIEFHGEKDDFKQSLFIEQPIFNTIQTIKSDKIDHISFIPIEPQKNIYFINVTLKCLSSSPISDDKFNTTPDNFISNKNTSHPTKKIYTKKSFICGSFFALCLLYYYAYIHYR